MRKRESDFERLVGQNLWRLESLVKQVEGFASSARDDTVLCGEEPTRVFPGAAFEILLHVGGRLAAHLILTVGQKFTNGCPRRARTSGGAVDDRLRGRRGGGGVLQLLKTWHIRGFVVTWIILTCHLVISWRRPGCLGSRCRR